MFYQPDHLSGEYQASGFKAVKMYIQGHAVLRRVTQLIYTVFVTFAWTVRR